jgi:DNA polymerase-3 subunit alpha
MFNNKKRLQATKQMSMFGGLMEPQEDDWLPEAQPWDKSVKLSREKEALGVYVTGHPLDAYRPLLKAQIRVTTADLAEAPDSQEVSLGVVVTSFKEKATKRGGRMAILMLEDLAGSVEALVFSEVYERVAPLLAQPSLPLWFKGHVVQEEKGPKLVAQEIAPLETALERLPSRLDLRLQAASLTLDHLLKLKEILRQHPGPVPAYLHFLHSQKDQTLALPQELALTPSSELSAEVNRLLGYPALSL